MTIATPTKRHNLCDHAATSARGRLAVTLSLQQGQSKYMYCSLYYISRGGVAYTISAEERNPVSPPQA